MGLLKNEVNVSTSVRVLLAIALSGSGCATTTPYVYNESTLNVKLEESPFHRVTYLRAYVDDGELVVYGKVEHREGHCAQKEHVDLSIRNDRGEDVRTEELPLKQSTSPKQHGWYGAAFRTRIEHAPVCGSSVVVVVHDGC